MEIKEGTTRLVILTKNYAIKIPNFKYEWKHFLLGLLGNLQEKRFSSMKDKRMCPVIFSLPLGFMVIMPKCREITREEFFSLDIDYYWEQSYKMIENQIVYYGDCKVPVENKQNSFGWYKGRIVAIDYGS